MTYIKNGFASAQRCVLFVLLLGIFSCEQEPPTSQKFLVARVYNVATLDAEAAYLKGMDKTNLPKDILDAVNVRQEELVDLGEELDVNPNIALNVSRCLPLDARVPPLPCPVREDVLASIPVGTQIELDLVGVFQDIPEDPSARVAIEQGSAMLLTTDGKKVFAQGSLNSYDKLFRYSWYQFEVKNPALAKKPLILRVTTVVITNQQSQLAVIEIPVPASMFQADNLY